MILVVVFLDQFLIKRIFICVTTMKLDRSVFTEKNYTNFCFFFIFFLCFLKFVVYCFSAMYWSGDCSR